MDEPENGKLGIQEDEESKKIMAGFKINSMRLRDGQTNKVLWEVQEWDNSVLNREEHFPKQTLKCKVVCREINFSSKEEIKDFKVYQKVYLGGHQIQEWNFEFGFVIPNSTNTWENVLEADEEQMIPADQLSGNMEIETTFISKNTVIYRSNMKVFYD